MYRRYKKWRRKRLIKKKREEKYRRARDFRNKYPDIYGNRRWWQP